MKKEKIILFIKILIIIILIINIYLSIKESKNYFITKLSINENYDMFNEKIFKDFSLYNKIFSEYSSIDKKELYSTPYIPNGFKFVYGTWNSGFVIEDEYENQFVWVPCNTKKDKKTAFLNKYNFDENPFIKKNECAEIYENIEDFFKSVYQNGGFYIARYETGTQSQIPVIKKDVSIYTNISYDEAKKISDNFYSNTDFTSSLINSYAYDTAYNWIISTNESNNLHKKREQLLTGNNSLNNIYDLNDTVWEWSTEAFYENMICRGISDNDIYSSEYSMGNRYALSKDTLLDTIGFRIILFKNSIFN